MDTMDTSGTSSKASNVEYVREKPFEVGPRYTDLKYIGEGAYGMVVYVDFALIFGDSCIIVCRHLVDLLSISALSKSAIKHRLKLVINVTGVLRPSNNRCS